MAKQRQIPVFHMVLYAAFATNGYASLAQAIIPSGSTMTHFCVITGWDKYNETIANYLSLKGQHLDAPQDIAGGLSANGTYLGSDGKWTRLIGRTKIAFLTLNNETKMEFLAGDPESPSWWRDVYLKRGVEVHHNGYVLPNGTQIWPIAQKFQAAGLGEIKQTGRWGNEHGADKPGAGCYVYLDSQETLGLTTELLANGPDCDSLPAPPQSPVGLTLV